MSQMSMLYCSLTNNTDSVSYRMESNRVRYHGGMYKDSEKVGQTGYTVEKEKVDVVGTIVTK